MNIIKKGFFGAALLALSVVAFAKGAPESGDLVLKPTPEQAQAALSATRILTRFHYKAMPLDAAMSQHIFDRDPVYIGVGGTIPFMGMLGERFPKTQFFITGVLGPHANAHGPNEFLHIDYARALTACVSLVLADHATRER